MKKLLLNLYLWPIFLGVTLFSLLVLPFLLVYGFFSAKTTPDRVLRKGIRLHGWVLTRIAPFMAPVKVEDRSGGIKPPVIFVANHCSSVDPYLFGMLPYENAFVTSWPYRIPVYKWIMRLASYINAEDGWQALLDKSAALMQGGCSLIIWPEGHRSKDGNLARFKKGAFELACRSMRPIVPVCILGTDRLLPPGARFFTPSRVKMVVLPPIESGPESGEDQVWALRDKVRETIAAELEKNGAGGANAFCREAQVREMNKGAFCKES